MCHRIPRTCYVRVCRASPRLAVGRAQRGREMKRLIAVAVFMAAGCGDRYIKPDVTVGAYNQDFEECDVQAKAIERNHVSPRGTPSGHAGWEQAHAGNEARDRCMMAKGYKVSR